MKSAEAFEADLGQFYGTEHYYYVSPLNKGIVGTDGVKYLMDNGCAWLVDIIVSYQGKLPADPYQTWTLKRVDSGAVVTCLDDYDKVLVTQEIEYTDCPIDHLALLVAPTQMADDRMVRCILLPSEN